MAPSEHHGEAPAAKKAKLDSKPASAKTKKANASIKKRVEKAEPEPDEERGDTGEGSRGGGTGTAWEEGAVQIFWQDVLRQYKPDWSFLHQAFDEYAKAGGQERTKKARTLYQARHIRGELLRKAGMKG